MIPDHLRDTVLALFLEVRIAHMFFAKPPGMIFFPHHEALLVAKIKKQRVIRIMGGTNGVRV